MNIYIICPVRHIEQHEREYIDKYVQDLRDNNCYVHYPVEKEQDQDSSDIIKMHRDAMLSCDEVHVYWNKESTGSHFDFGMAYALNKPIKYFNDITKTELKSFQNALIDQKYYYEKHIELINDIKEKFKEELNKIKLDEFSIKVIDIRTIVLEDKYMLLVKMDREFEYDTAIPIIDATTKVEYYINDKYKDLYPFIKFHDTKLPLEL